MGSGSWMPAAHTERRGGTNLCNRACQSYRDFCKKQLPADPATTSSPPPVCPEPLDPVGGRVGPPPARVSKWCLQGGMLTAGERRWARRERGVLAYGIQQETGVQAWGLSSPKKEKHWESLPAVAAKRVQISCQDFGKDREVPHKSLSTPIPHVFLCPLS